MSKQTIESAKEYSDIFEKHSADAAKVAIDARRFEIELYWKRATYFWTLLAAVFVGFFVLQKSEAQSSQLASFLISCIGLIFSVAWYMISRASAFWHANWDAHVHQIEDNHTGPLHKTKIDDSVFKLRNVMLPYRCSSTKIHAATSLYVILIWLFLAIHSLSVYYNWKEPISGFNVIVISSLTIVFLYILFFRTDPHKAKKVTKFYIEQRAFPDSKRPNENDKNK